MKIDRKYPPILTVAAVICGILAAYPAAAAVSYERTPSGDPATAPITVSFSFDDYSDLSACAGFSYWAISAAADGVACPTCPNTWDGSWNAPTTKTDVEIFPMSELSSPAGVDFGYICSNDGEGAFDPENDAWGEEEVGIIISGGAAATGIFPALEYPRIAANTASVVGQGWPVAGLAAGIPLGLGFLGWIVRIVARRRLL